MALDYLAFTRLIDLISTLITNGKIVKISQISNEEFLFLIRNNSTNYNLLVSTHPNMSYINIVDSKPASNHINTNLLMLLRKHLENGTIINVNQLNNDRVVAISITGKDDYFRNTKHVLYVELIGRASNLILVDGDNVIIDSLKKIPLEYNNIRTIQPGIHYTLPDKPSKEELPNDLKEELKFRNITENELNNLINKSESIYVVTGTNKPDFHFIPLTYLNCNVSQYKWNTGLDVFYKDNLENERHRQFTSDIEHLVKSEIKRLEKKVKKLEIELSKASDSDNYRYYGDLLLTYCQGIKTNSNSITCHDEDKNKDITIEIDPKYDIFYNANNYYKKYKKSKVAIIKIQEQIDLCNESLTYFNSVLYHLSEADVMVAEQIKEELTEQGFYRRFKTPAFNGKKKEKAYRPLAIKYKDYVIYVGQNNLQNEYLSFKIAKKTHMFFHIKDGPGSHVIAACDHVDEKDIRFIANIAAYYSSYKMSSTVAVNYTLVKNIKKIPGGLPGKVIINNYKTTYVDPDYNIFKDLIEK